MNRPTKIQLLPEHIIDQIKAGEVIESPSGLLKEIIENSIDANATDISIQIKDNGLDLISIIDNGDGISFDDLPLAFCRHATSKISQFEDIYHLNSFGFRGEALASMASIARLSCQSSPKGHPSNAGKIIIHGGEQIAHLPVAQETNGTSLYIQDLFFNTPVRLKFTKSKQSEKNSIEKILLAFLISNPQIRFSLQINENEKEIFSPSSLEQRFIKIIKTKDKYIDVNETNVLVIKESYEKYQVTILVTKNTSKSAQKIQNIFCNNRLFFDKNIQQSIARNLTQVWGEQATGHYVVLLNVPANEVDVNIHPSKITLKFADYSLVYSLISSSIKKALNLTQSIGTVEIRPSQSDSQAIPKQENNIQKDFIDFSSKSFDDHFNLQRLSDRYIMFNYQGHLYLGDLKLIVKEYFNYILEIERNENETIPLMISEPLNMTKVSKALLEQLKKSGFDIDSLTDSKQFVLRSVPAPLRKTNRSLLVTLIENSETLLTNTEKFPISLELGNQITSLIPDIPKDILISSATELNDETIKTLFEAKR